MFKLFKKINIHNQNTNHKNNNNFEISNEYSNSKIKRFSEIDDFIDISKESFEELSKNDYNQKEFMNDFIKEIISTILDSRKDKNDNYINTSIHSNNSNGYNDKSYSIDIDELFLYNDFSPKRNDIQKFTLEFYLIKNNKKINLLVEKWKFSYKFIDNENIKNNYDINYFNNKLSILKKSIITYSRLLPLYQYILNNEQDYSINFKYYHNENNNTNKNKGKFLSNQQRKVSLKNNNLFSFKINVKYISQKEINNIFNEIEEKTILEKYINKPKSLSFHKSKSNLNGFESIKKKKDDNSINYKRNENNIKTCTTDINDNIQDINSSCDDSSFYLNISDFNIDEFKSIEKEKEINSNENNISKRKLSMLSNSNDPTEELTPRNNEESKINENREINLEYINKNIVMNKKGNKEVNSILKEYSLLKKMMLKSSSFDNVKTEKLIRFEKMIKLHL